MHLFEEFQAFIELLANAIKFFYRIEKDSQKEYCFFNKENLKTFITEFLFEQDQLYDKFFAL